MTPPLEYWTLKQKQQAPKLGLQEKLAIIDDTDKNLLSKRSEVIS